MKTKVGTILMVLGAALVFGALALFLCNQTEAADAERASADLMPQLREEIELQQEGADETVDYIPGTPLELMDPSALEMTEVEIDGYHYIGYLSIPALGLELPVMADWDYTRLKIAPCRYAGTDIGNDLVIMGHNYARHFGRTEDLVVGDRITFTNMDGVTTEYEMVARDILAPTAVEEMTAGEYDLTLFTCTYGGGSRETVYFDRVENE
ncbi:MAG: sortase [Oscillospiraceae bacterium]|nr:sortase [Oscillospiraceae bacterium]